MKDRCLDHFRDFSTVQAGFLVQCVGGGEANLVVDHHVNGAAHVIAFHHGHVEQFHVDTLAFKGRITMNQHGYHDVFIAVFASNLAGPHRTQYHRIDDFQVRWIKSQGQMHITTRGGDV
jgi:predicted nucleotidyltransferase